MSRALIEVLQLIEMDSRLVNDKDRWLDVDLLALPETSLVLVQQVIALGRKDLYAAAGCADIQNVDTLYMVGFNTLQYHIKQLVLQTCKGKIHVPSPFGGGLIRREPIWRGIKPVMTVY